MEPPASTSSSSYWGSSKLSLFQESPLDLDLIEVSASSVPSSSGNRKRKLNQNKVVNHDVVEIEDDDEDEDAVLIIGVSNSDIKNKQPMAYHNDWHKQIQDAISNDCLGSSTNNRSKSDALMGIFGSSGTASGSLSLNSQKAKVEDEIDRRFRSFKRFDTVSDHSDHHFINPETYRDSKGRLLKAPSTRPTKNWTKRIQHEWKILEKDLPETIYVRAYEDRMDLLRAVIIGAVGTPYHDGLFFFDIHFPPGYPGVPPLVHYHSGGLRLNPNLYACGKVCLSLLGTWNGHGCENWNSSKSTMLQVLVSIQALILNAKPYFNEPGYEYSANTPLGETHSLAYNEDIFLKSCKTMLYSLRRPPRHFEDFVAGHFRQHGRAILMGCITYMDGAQVGTVVGDGIQDVDEGHNVCSPTFRKSLGELIGDLLKEFTTKGADCLFLTQKVKDAAAKSKNIVSGISVISQVLPSSQGLPFSQGLQFY